MKSRITTIPNFFKKKVFLEGFLKSKKSPYASLSFSTKDNKSIIRYNVFLRRPPFNSIVFEGGGTKGVAYAGALEKSESLKMLDDIQKVGGSSVGAIAAMLFSLGISPSGISKVLRDTNMKSLLDPSLALATDDVDDPVEKELILQEKFNYKIGNEQGDLGHGVYAGNELLRFLGDRVADQMQEIYDNYTPNEHKAEMKKIVDKKNGVTFADLERVREMCPDAKVKSFHVTATNFTDRKLEIFNYNTQPDMPIAFAVRISASFPWAFKSVYYKGKQYIDGGVFNNFPMSIFDNTANEKYRLPDKKGNLEVLGFMLDDNSKINQRKLWDNNGLKSFTKKLYDSLQEYFVGMSFIDEEEKNARDSYERFAETTVRINVDGSKTLDFSMNEKTKTDLVMRGVKDVGTFYTKYVSPDNAIKIELENLDDLSNYIPEESIKHMVEKTKVFVDIDKFLKDLPFDYFKEEIEKAIKLSVKTTLKNTSESVDMNEIQDNAILSLQDKLYSLFESSLKTNLYSQLKDAGLDKELFQEVTFDFLDAGSNSPITRIMDNITNNSDGNGSYLDNRVEIAMQEYKLHTLNQSAADIQKQINVYDLAILESQELKKTYEKTLSELQAEFEKTEVTKRLRLQYRISDIRSAIAEEESKNKQKTEERLEKQKDLEDRDADGWDAEKEKRKQDIIDNTKRNEENARRQEKSIFDLKPI